MMKRIAFMAAMFLAALLFSIPNALADETVINPQATYIFPLSLQTIEEEAFSNTAAETVIFADSLVYIGENTFSRAKNLADVFIPESTRYIAESAFSTDSSLVIHGVKGSYAEDWAKKHKIPFVEENIWKHILDNDRRIDVPELEMDSLYKANHPERIAKIVPRSENEDESKRPQDRPELNPIDYRFP